ncbi:MAG: hypothetical protein ACE5IR_27085 [bacterium]
MKIQTNLIAWALKPTVENRIIRVQDIVLVEILKANDWQRPITFSTTVASVNKIGLDDYLALEGLTLRLKSHKQSLSLQRLRNNLLHVYRYEGVHSEHVPLVDEIQELLQNYRSSFFKLAKAYHDVGNKTEAREILTTMNEKLPESVLPYRQTQMKTNVETLLKDVSGVE